MQGCHPLGGFFKDLPSQQNVYKSHVTKHSTRCISFDCTHRAGGRRLRLGWGARAQAPAGCETGVTAVLVTRKVGVAKHPLSGEGGAGQGLGLVSQFGFWQNQSSLSSAVRHLSVIGDLSEPVTHGRAALWL